MFTEPELSTGLAHSGPSAKPHRLELGPPLSRPLPMPGHCCEAAHTSAVAPGPTGAQGCRDLARPRLQAWRGEGCWSGPSPTCWGPSGTRASRGSLASTRAECVPWREADVGPSPTATSSVVWPWINPQQHGFAPRYDTGTGPRGLTGRLLLQEEAGPECPAGGRVGYPDQVAAPRSSLCPRENWGDLCPKPARLQPSETLVGVSQSAVGNGVDVSWPSWAPASGGQVLSPTRSPLGVSSWPSCP